MKGHRDLLVWQKAMELVTEVYEITGTFPRDELYGLVNQLRRAAVSVPSNIAEGFGRRSRKEFSQFLGLARGSQLEVETQLEIARNLGYIPQDAFSGLLSRSNEICRMINGLRSWCDAA